MSRLRAALVYDVGAPPGELRAAGAGCIGCDPSRLGIVLGNLAYLGSANVISALPRGNPNRLCPPAATVTYWVPLIS